MLESKSEESIFELNKTQKIALVCSFNKKKKIVNGNDYARLHERSV